jgi:hypothetical protein
LADQRQLADQPGASVAYDYDPNPPDGMLGIRAKQTLRQSSCRLMRLCSRDAAELLSML